MATINNAPTLSLANATAATLPITANVIPGTSITYTGTLPTGSIFGELSYVNFMTSTGISTPKLRFVFDYVLCPSLQTITFTGIDSVVMATGNAESLLTSISVPDATQFAIAGTFVSLTTLSCPNVIQLCASVSSPASTAGFSNLSFPVLTTFSFPNVEYLVLPFTASMASLTTFSMPKLKTMGGPGTTAFQPNMPVLTTLSLPSLTDAQSLSFAASLLTTLNLPVLRSINDTVVTNAMVLNLLALPTFSLPALVESIGTTTLTLNVCTTFSMPVVVRMGYPGKDTIITLPLVTTLSFPALTTIGNRFTLAAATLTSLSLPVLATIGTILTFTVAALTTLSLPALVSVVNDIVVTAANMTTFSMGATLKSVGGNFTLNNAKLNQASVDGILASLAALDGTNGTTAYSSKTVLINGGTNSTPSAAGLVSKATLVARGCTVTNN